MSLPTSEPVPDETSQLPPARRRRNRRLIVPDSAGERAELLKELSHNTSTSFDFLLFSLLAGVLLGAAILFRSPAIALLALLAAPFMGPVAGLSLATILGAGGYFLRTLAAVAIAALLVFASGMLAGLTAPLMAAQTAAIQSPLPAFLQVRLYWLDFAALSAGVIWIITGLVRSEHKPVLPSVMVAYELLVPVCLAGFSLASGATNAWADAVLVFVVYLAWAALLGAVVLAVMGFRPLNLLGYTIGTTLALVGVLLFIAITGMGTALVGKIALPTLQPTITALPAQASAQASAQAPAPSGTPILPTPLPSFTATRTLVPSATPTQTMTPAPTPVWAVVHSPNGVLIRETPGASGKILGGALEGSLVQVLPDTLSTEGVMWVRVITNDGLEGWVVLALLATATPTPPAA